MLLFDFTSNYRTIISFTIEKLVPIKDDKKISMQLISNLTSPNSNMRKAAQLYFKEETIKERF